MHSSRRSRLVPGIAIVFALATAHPLHAQLPLTFAQWESFFWLDGIIDGDGFSFTSPLQIRLRVTDGFESGDAFDLFMNGSAIAFDQTPSVPMGFGDFTIDNGDAAFADPDLSKRDLVLSPGTYTITLALRDDAEFGFGQGFIRVDEITTTTTPVATTPEPSALLLLATGLAGLGAAARRRLRRNTNA